MAKARQGLASSKNKRFLRCFWEVTAGEMPPDGSLSKGRSYQKWAGLESLRIDWSHDGAAIKPFAEELYGSATRTIKNQAFNFVPIPN
jgi:hypothetical protein